MTTGTWWQNSELSSSIRSKGRWGPVFRAISTQTMNERTTKSSSLFSKNGKVLEAVEALQRFAGYFEDLLDIPPPSFRIDTSEMTPP